MGDGRHQNQDSCENQEKLSVITPAAHTGGRTAQIMAGPAQSARQPGLISVMSHGDSLLQRYVRP